MNASFASWNIKQKQGTICQQSAAAKPVWHERQREDTEKEIKRDKSK